MGRTMEETPANNLPTTASTTVLFGAGTSTLLLWSARSLAQSVPNNTVSFPVRKL